MKAMILAAGLGSRLRSLTSSKPKALVEINAKPVLAYVIENLIAAGVDSIVVNLHYLSDQIKQFIADANYDCEFLFSEEEDLLDTGGAIKKAKPLLEDSESFILHNCDIYTDLNLNDVIKAHKSQNNAATLAVSENKSDRFLWFKSDFSFVGCENKQTGFRYLVCKDNQLVPYDYNCITILNTFLFQYFDQLADKFTLFEWLMKAVASGESIKGFDIKSAYWIDIGTLEDLEQVNTYLNHEK